MLTTEYLQWTNLHGAVVESLTWAGGVVMLMCSSFLMSMEGEGDPHNVTVTLGGVSSVYCDNDPVPAIEQEGEDGSILDFSREGDVATLTMEWERYTPNETITRVYTIRYRTFAITAEREGARG
ncbi:MAG: hypothetical protein NT133_15475 [Alphaproteobacteria bacterium]|nr:hypothetical protein [Alphaproteobacteria bacterium]